MFGLTSKRKYMELEATLAQAQIDLEKSRDDHVRAKRDMADYRDDLTRFKENTPVVELRLTSRGRWFGKVLGSDGSVLASMPPASYEACLSRAEKLTLPHKIKTLETS